MGEPTKNTASNQPQPTTMRSVFSAKTRLLVLGDRNHNAPEIQEALSSMLEDFKAAGGTHVFLEYDRAEQPRVDRYLQLYQRYKQDALTENEREEMRELYFDGTPVETCAQLGLKAVYMDIDLNSEEAKKYYESILYMTDRTTAQLEAEGKVFDRERTLADRAMSDLVAQHLLKNPKAKGILLVGTYHTDSTQSRIFKGGDMDEILEKKLGRGTVKLGAISLTNRGGGWFSNPPQDDVAGIDDEYKTGRDRLDVIFNYVYPFREKAQEINENMLNYLGRLSGLPGFDKVMCDDMMKQLSSLQEALKTREPTLEEGKAIHQMSIRMNAVRPLTPLHDALADYLWLESAYVYALAEKETHGYEGEIDKLESQRESDQIYLDNTVAFNDPMPVIKRTQNMDTDLKNACNPGVEPTPVKSEEEALLVRMLSQIRSMQQVGLLQEENASRLLYTVGAARAAIASGKWEEAQTWLTDAGAICSCGGIFSPSLSGLRNACNILLGNCALNSYMQEGKNPPDEGINNTLKSNIGDIKIELDAVDYEIDLEKRNQAKPESAAQLPLNVRLDLSNLQLAFLYSGDSSFIPPCVDTKPDTGRAV